MKCPHCLVEYHDDFKQVFIERDVEGAWKMERDLCPACKRIILRLSGGSPAVGVHGLTFGVIRTQYYVHPRSASRPPAQTEVLPSLAADYNEACRILTDSPKSAAALGRRTLQAILRDTAKVTPGNLAVEIRQILDQGTLPSHLAEAIDTIRILGNFAAHPIKSTNTGEIVEVEPDEAEWTLDVLHSLFDFYFVQPEILAKKRAKINEKLQSAGKDPLR